MAVLMWYRKTITWFRLIKNVVYFKVHKPYRYPTLNILYQDTIKKLKVLRNFLNRYIQVYSSNNWKTTSILNINSKNLEAFDKWRFIIIVFLNLEYVNNVQADICFCTDLFQKLISSELFLKCRSSLPEVLVAKGFLKICNKFTGEHLCRRVISMKLQSNFVGCSPVNLLHIFKNIFP